MSSLLTLTCKAILFDMDGTLVDSTRVVELAWTRWAERNDVPLEAVLSFSHGRPSSATMNHFFPARDNTPELEEMALQEETVVEGILAVPGALKIVSALQQDQWAIVTSAWRTLAETRVRAAGLPLPRILVPVDEIRNGKPDPEGFLNAARQLGVAPADCLVFEDTRPGIDAGLSAGMQVVALLTTMPAASLQHRPLIRDFRDVTVYPNGAYLKLTVEDHS